MLDFFTYSWNDRSDNVKPCHQSRNVKKSTLMGIELFARPNAPGKQSLTGIKDDAIS